MCDHSKVYLIVNSSHGNSKEVKSMVEEEEWEDEEEEEEGEEEW